MGAAGLADTLLREGLGGPRLCGLLVLGATITGDLDLSRTDLECTIVLATEDTIVSPAPGARAEDGSLVADGLRRCPKRRVLEVVQGGNHAGFGHYGPQAFGKQKDGIRLISLAEQQDLVLRHATAFVSRL